MGIPWARGQSLLLQEALQAAQPQRGMRQQGDQVLAEPDADVDQGNEELAYQGGCPTATHLFAACHAGPLAACFHKSLEDYPGTTMTLLIVPLQVRACLQ